MEAVTGATNSLLPKLGALLKEEYKLQDKVKKDIESLQTELIFMNAALRTVAEVPEDELDEQVRIWAVIIKELSYDMEDAVSAFMGGVHGHGHATLDTSIMELFRKAFNMFCMCKTHHRIADMIEEIKSLTTEVALLRDRYQLGNFAHLKERPQTGKEEDGLGGYLADEHQEATPQFIRIKELVGVNADMARLHDWVISDENKQLGVLCLCGFSGVGKTAAAMELYRKCGVEFKRRAMVTVFHNTDPDLVLRDILRQVRPQVSYQQGHNSTGSISDRKNGTARMLTRLSQIRLRRRDQDEEDRASNKEHETIRRDLREHLRENRYLLLIDDVWSSSTWQNIKRYFPDNDKGSRIIVTTRFQAVATICAPHKDNDRVHPVNVLSGDEPKKLFEKSLSECKRTAASQESRSNVPDRVWEMCGGLPLAIVTMAGLVASKPLRVQSEWTEVCNSLFPEPEKCRKPEDFMRIIHFCYNDLPSDLKTCTLYLSIFPKGRKISRKRLTRRWISEGFVSEKKGLSVEDVAETCFNQLIERKIMRPVEHNSNGRVKSCQVHDMVLEFIMSKASEEDFVTVVGGYWSMATRSNKVRRLSLHSSDSTYANKADSMNLSHVRSVTVFRSMDQLRFKSFKTGVLQVLDLEGCRGFKANHISGSDICEMTLLKYLSLRGTDISKLPSNIGNLKCLETLDIRQTEIEELPKTVGQLERISNILGGDKRTRKTLKLPKDVKGTMKGIRVLSGIEIIEGSSAASDLSYFTRLRKLAIYKLHKGDQIFKDLLSSIQYLSGYSLQTLVIDDDSSDFLSTLDSMTSHPTDLRTLELSGKLLKIPKWLPELNDLVKLTLSASALRTDNLVLLSELRSLFSLTFSISAANKDPEMAAILEKNKSDSRGGIFFPAGGFGKLKLLRIFVPLLPSLNFSKKGTLVLERLELRFKRLEGVHGMDKLRSLHDVLLTVDDKAGELTKSILDDLKKSSSSRKYTLIVNEYHGFTVDWCEASYIPPAEDYKFN